MNTEAPAQTENFDPAYLDAQVDPDAFNAAFESADRLDPSVQQMVDMPAAEMVDPAQNETPTLNKDLLELFFRSANNPELSDALSRFMVADLAIRTAVHYDLDLVNMATAAREEEYHGWAHREEEKKKTTV